MDKAGQTNCTGVLGSSRFKTLRRVLSGQSALEFALLLPIILLMLAGVVDIGRGIQTYVAITNAAREGARYGSVVDPSDSISIRGRVRSELSGSGIVIANDGDIVISYPIGILNDTCGGTITPGCPIRVRVNYVFIPIMGSILGLSEIPISNSVDMIIY